MSLGGGMELLGFGTVVESLMFPEADSSLLVVLQAPDQVIYGILGQIQPHGMGWWFGRGVGTRVVSAERQPSLGDLQSRHGEL